MGANYTLTMEIKKAPAKQGNYTSYKSVIPCPVLFSLGKFWTIYKIHLVLFHRVAQRSTEEHKEQPPSSYLYSSVPLRAFSEQLRVKLFHRATPRIAFVRSPAGKSYSTELYRDCQGFEN